MSYKHLSYMKLLIIGFGQVGQATAMSALVSGNDFRVFVYDRNEAVYNNFYVLMTHAVEADKTGMYRDYAIAAQEFERLTFIQDGYNEIYEKSPDYIFISVPEANVEHVLANLIHAYDENGEKIPITIIQSSLSLEQLDSIGQKFDRELLSERVAICPERIMEHKKIFKFVTSDRIIGATKEVFDEIVHLLKLMGHVGDRFRTTPEEASLTKLVENSHRYWDIVFSHMVSDLCRARGMEFEKIRHLVNTCVERNMLKSGIGIGGQCLPQNITNLRNSVPFHAYHLLGKIINYEQRRDEMIRSWLVDKMVNGTNSPLWELKILFLGVAYRPEGYSVHFSIPADIASHISKIADRTYVYDSLTMDGSLSEALEMDCDVIVLMQPSAQLLEETEQILASHPETLFLNLTHHRYEGHPEHLTINCPW